MEVQHLLVRPAAVDACQRLIAVTLVQVQAYLAMALFLQQA